MKYILFLKSVIAARFDSEFNTEIPAEADEVSDEVFFRTINEQDGVWRKVDGEIVKIAFPDPQPVIKTQFTSLEFLDRFTENEQLAVVQATMVSAPVKLWYDRLLAASFVDITDPRTEGGIDALIGVGLIDADRKEALLTPQEV